MKDTQDNELYINIGEKGITAVERSVANATDLVVNGFGVSVA